jgi:hypothetical protein
MVLPRVKSIFRVFRGHFMLYEPTIWRIGALHTAYSSNQGNGVLDVFPTQQGEQNVFPKQVIRNREWE